MISQAHPRAYTLPQALERIIDDGKIAATASYSKSEQKHKLDGSLAGFEACRNKTPLELKELLREVRLNTDQKRKLQAPDYWYHRCYEAEIEWTCNVLSAILMSNKMEVIVIPTGRGVMKAAEIIGVAEYGPRV